MSSRPPALLLLAALSASLGGCDDTPTEMQRDVYAGEDALLRCVADWGNEELCQKRLDDAEKAKLAQHSGGQTGGASIFIWGPAYGSERLVSYGGQTYQPATSRAVNTAAFSPSNYKVTSFSAPKPAFTGTPSVRGGFGGTAAARGGGSAS